jgi:hypothetical protein
MADATGDDDQHSNDEVLLLARLLGDASLRARFLQQPRQVADELTQCPVAIAFLESLDHVQLEAQAETLRLKRQHEVALLLPETWQNLGKKAATLFETYSAEASWPTGHNRHQYDAEAFGLWLTAQEGDQVHRTELNRVRFKVSGVRFSIRLIWRQAILSGLQILFRNSSGQCKDRVIGFRQRQSPSN